MYRLMFSDLDETLLVNHHVPKMNQEAILKAREQGLKFVPCTGRAFNMIPEILKEIGTYDQEGEYSLCFNGGLIVENKNNKIKIIIFSHVFHVSPCLVQYSGQGDFLWDVTDWI